MNRNKLLLYSFYPFPLKQNLIEDFPSTFIFHQLTHDLEIFKNEIQKHKPKCILGIAKSKNKYS